MSSPEVPPARTSWPLATASALAFVGICGWPYLRWWAHPSLFDDDFLRVGSLRRATLGEALFRPFNEHIAPLFEVVTWLAWVGGGRQVLAIPMAFQVASYLGFATTVGLLALWVGREVGSRTAAMVAVSLSCLSAVSSETVLWYSASSFQWAASATLAGLLAASMATASPTTRGRVGWSVAAGLAGLLAPAFSAIGVLAGPLAALRVASGVDRPSSLPRRLGWSILPTLGTAGYLLLCQRFRFGELVLESVHRSFDPVAALWATARAPAAVLIPGLVGLPEQSGRISGVGLAGSTVIGLAFALRWASRSRLRPLILSSLALIFAGYFSTYATRARPGDPWIFAIQRYHLFPEIGLIGLIVAAASPVLRRLDSGRAKGVFAASCLATLLAFLQYPAMKAASDRAFRYPEQPRALEAARHLEEACRRVGVTLPQAMAALEPIRTPWYPRPWPFNPLLNLMPTGPSVPRVPDAMVRSTLVNSLSPEDRECLFGGMDASLHESPASRWPGPPVEARPVVESKAGQGGGTSRGSRHHLDYVVGPEADDCRALGLQGFRSSRGMEIWWAGEGEDWSPYRSVRWQPARDRDVEGVAVAFDTMPHWRPGRVRRLRVVVEESGPVAFGVIRFLR